MSYEKDMKATWDEYATRITLEHDPDEVIRIGRRIGFDHGWQVGFKKGTKKGIKEKSLEEVKNLLTNKFTVEEIAKIVNVPEAFVLKVQKSMK